MRLRTEKRPQVKKEPCRGLDDVAVRCKWQMKTKGTRECPFLRPCHFLKKKETAGKRSTHVNVGFVSSLECIILFAHSSCIIRALFSGIPQSSWHHQQRMSLAHWCFSGSKVIQGVFVMPVGQRNTPIRFDPKQSWKCFTPYFSRFWVMSTMRYNYLIFYMVMRWQQLLR